MTQICPCGSGQAFDACCGPLLSGAQPPSTAESLMRSRYTAYVRGEIGYLGRTLHPEHRADYDEAATRKWAATAQWLGLEVGALEGGGQADETGTVEFIARYRDAQKGTRHTHHERAEFRRQDGTWYFTDGHPVAPKTVVHEGGKVGRNDPCPCGSGRKYKKCCGA